LRLTEPLASVAMANAKWKMRNGKSDLKNCIKDN
jgi:hypothetical protein